MGGVRALDVAVCGVTTCLEAISVEAVLVLCPADELFKLIMHFPRFVGRVRAPHLTISDANKYSKHSFFSIYL